MEGYKVDGLVVFNWGSDVLFEYFECVELFKGLLGFMYGFGMFGGIVNFVIKCLINIFGGSVMFGFISGGMFKELVDVGGCFGLIKVLGVCLGVVYEEGDIFVDGGYIKCDLVLLVLDVCIMLDL